MICDNSFCAAYSKETRGAKPISETIPPEIDNTTDLSYQLNLDDESDDGYVLTKGHPPPPSENSCFAHFVFPDCPSFGLPSASAAQQKWSLTICFTLSLASISKWECDFAGRSVTICWQLLFQLNDVRRRIWDQVLDEETVFGLNS